jgi:hypothetical protein
MPDIRLLNIEFQAFGIHAQRRCASVRRQVAGCITRPPKTAGQIIAMPPLT